MPIYLKAIESVAERKDVVWIQTYFKHWNNESHSQWINLVMVNEKYELKINKILFVVLNNKKRIKYVRKYTIR